MTAADAPPVFRDIVVIGGGCYGTFYAGQLATAQRRGKIGYRSVRLIDRNPRCQATTAGVLSGRIELEVAEWGEFLDRFLAAAPPGPAEADDAIVPSPLMPHLMAEWLERRLRATDRSVERLAVTEPLGTPYDVLAPDGTRYVSFADWLCPTHCVEPHVCPVTRAARTWEMADAIGDYARRLGRHRAVAAPAIFLTRHRAFGVGMFDVAESRQAWAVSRAAVDRSGEVDVLVATISSCHGAITALRIR